MRKTAESSVLTQLPQLTYVNNPAPIPPATPAAAARTVSWRPALALLAAVLFPVTAAGQPDQPRPVDPDKIKNVDAKDAAAREREQAARDAKAAGEVVAAGAGIGIATVVGLIVVNFVLQLLPIAVAFYRDHPSKWAITLVALLLGWTCVGWFVALVWSLTGTGRDGRTHDDDRPRRRRRRDDDH